MNIHKFRAWNKISNTMHPFINSTDNWSFSFLNQDVFIWMQYTGLKDKNGKEIYEGDIFNWNKFTGEVIFKDGCFVFDTKDNYSMTMRDHNSNEFEVIGNIYQKHIINK